MVKVIVRLIGVFAIVFGVFLFLVMLAALGIIPTSSAPSLGLAVFLFVMAAGLIGCGIVLLRAKLPERKPRSDTPTVV